MNKKQKDKDHIDKAFELVLKLSIENVKLHKRVIRLEREIEEIMGRL